MWNDAVLALYSLACRRRCHSRLELSVCRVLVLCHGRAVVSPPTINNLMVQSPSRTQPLSAATRLVAPTLLSIQSMPRKTTPTSKTERNVHHCVFSQVFSHCMWPQCDNFCLKKQQQTFSQSVNTSLSPCCVCTSCVTVISSMRRRR